MHKKIKAELVSLAHSILELENTADVAELQKKARKVYEKLTILKFIDKHLFVEKNEQEILDVVEKTVVETHLEVEKNVESEITPEEKIEAIFEEESTLIKDDLKEIPSLQFTLEEEFKDAISADVATEMFEKAGKETVITESQIEKKQKSLNDVFNSNIKVDLNDRIAFVKHLFDGSQEDFNRVLSQLNSFDTENEAKDFIAEFVKPDYDWSEKEVYEKRLMELIERKFL